METLNLYEKDFYAWTQEQAKLIKEKAFAKLDIQHLVEEVEDMGKHEKRELENRLTVLLMHLLKWKYQPNYINKKSWYYTIKEQRKRIGYHLVDNPSLRNDEHLCITLLRSYESAIYEAVKETGLDEAIFPVECPWTFKQILNDEFYPE